MAQVLLVVAAAVASMATSPAEFPWCAYSTTPFTGQTAVPVDSALVVIGRDVDDGLPRLSNSAFRLERLRESDVVHEVIETVGVTVRRAGAVTIDGQRFVTWTVRPDAQLAPDARYQLTAIDVSDLATPHHPADVDEYADGYSWQLAERVFTTGSAPRLIAAVSGPPAADPESVTLRLLFSEPMDLDSLVDRVTVGDGAIDLPVLSTPSSAPDRPHVVELQVDATAADGRAGWVVTVDGEARGVTGVRLHGAGRGLAATGRPGDDGEVEVDDPTLGEILSSIVKASPAEWLDMMVGGRPYCEPEEVYE